MPDDIAMHGEHHLQVFEDQGKDMVQQQPFAPLQKHGPVNRFIAPCTIAGEGSEAYNKVPCEWRGGRE
jgi:hypothetical protein